MAGDTGAGATLPQRIACAAGTLSLLLAGLAQLLPPACGRNPSAADFSCERALAHVRVIASAPHPAGSPAHAAVRDYLLGQMRLLGLSPRVLPAKAVAFGRLVTLENLLGRLPGTTAGPAVLLCCHYDSVFRGPGAADDGAAVGALLETMRALQSRPPLRNDVYLLITDGEELGLLGARALVKTPGTLPDVGILLNFDARGTSGPSILFETSGNNAGLVRQFAAVAPDPVGTSLGYDVYRKMPNDTDFTIFRRAGYRGLNFAFIGNYVYYHTAEDSVGHLDRRTLNQIGLYALSLARHFAQADLMRRAERPVGEATFFNPLRGVMVVYDRRWNWPITALVVLLTVAVFVRLIRRRAIRAVGLAVALASLLLGTAAVISLDWATWKIIELALGRGWLPSFQGFLFRTSPTPGVVTATILTLAAVDVSIAVFAALVVRRIVRVSELSAVGALVWAAVAVAVTGLLPGGAYLAAWPLIFALGGMFMSTWHRAPGGWLCVVATLVFSSPTLLLLPPSISLFMTALTVRNAFLVAPIILLTVWLLITSGCVPLMLGYRRWISLSSSAKAGGRSGTHPGSGRPTSETI